MVNIKQYYIKYFDQMTIIFKHIYISYSKQIWKIEELGNDRLIDCFQRHVNPPRAILYLEVKKSCSIYVHIYIFCVVFTKESFLSTVLFNTNNFWPIIGTLIGTTSPS